MNCRYKYKGHDIGTVEQLNDFLLEKHPHMSKLGDKVFQRTARQLAAQKRLDKSQEKIEELQRRYGEAKLVADSVIDGEEYMKAHRPYVGVSEFLKGQRNKDGKLYFPEFIPGEYWANRYMEWDKGNFTDDEISLFFDGDESKAVAIPVGNYNNWRDSNGVIKEEFGSDEQKRLRKMMEDKWQAQANIGTEIHNVLQLYFTEIKSGENKGKLWAEVLKENPGKWTSIFKNNIKTSLPNERIDEILEYAASLKKEIEQRYGENCVYYPEFTLSSELNKPFENRDDLHLLGRIDLLVIDEAGRPQIIDYKTSPKIYDDYSTAKKLGFTYQLGTYERMLRRWNLKTSHTNVMIAPIQMEGFRKEGDNWTFDKVVKGTTDIVRSDGEVSRTSGLASLDDRLTEDWLNNNMDEYMQAPLVPEVDSQDVVTNVKAAMEEWFPMYGNNRERTDQEVKDIITEQLGDNWLDPKTNTYHFTPKGSKITFEVANKGASSEADFFNKVKNWYQGYGERLIKRTINVANALKSAQEGDVGDIEIDDEWMRYRLSRYASKEWEVMEEFQPIVEQFGMIMVKNNITNNIDIIKMSMGDPTYLYDWGGRKHTNLIGAHEIDDYENARSNSMMLKAAKGNIEMMEAMLVLNNLNFSQPVNIGKISMMSFNSKSEKAHGLEASNKELMYSWNKLNQVAPIAQPNTLSSKDSSVKFLTKLEQAEAELKYILSQITKSQNRATIDRFSKFNPALTTLTGIVGATTLNVQNAIDALNNLRKTLESEFNMDQDLNAAGKSIHSETGLYNTQYAKTLYQYISQALLELQGIDIHQELHPQSKYLQSARIQTEGISGTYIDNAGNFSNKLLNQITSLVLDGVQSAREIGFSRIRTLRDKTEQLKKDTGYSGFIEHTIGNQTSLYDGMTYFHQNGDLLFKNPWDESDPEIMAMSDTKKEYLKWVITEFNKNRFPNLSEAQILMKQKENTSDYFQVPLVSASFASKVNTDGWLGWLKNRFRVFKDENDKFTIKSIKEGTQQALKDFQSEYLSDDVEQQIKERNKSIFDTVNMMNQSMGPNRINDIAKLRQKYGDGYFERDLERLLGTHIWAYATHEAFETRMPLIKGAYVSLAITGNSQNQDYSEVQQFVKEYVENKINHQSIVDDKLKAIKGVTGTIQQIVSWMALAFSPVQFSYQLLEGIWKDCKLIITKPDGTEAFTFKNMKKAASLVYKEMFHYSDKLTVLQGINAFYGINDMDAASFADNNSSNNHGIFNFFGKFAYKFSSRPDFYNRMTIFVSQMLEDGTLEAHSINENNELVYDWKKDKRFDKLKFENGTVTGDKKQLELYYALAQQLIRENARNSDGSIFKIGDVPPKAYSNREAEAKKAIGDTMYGYYDTSKKSLIQATLLGGLMMQMRTYWSSKKNQYLAPGGIKNQGKWVYMTDHNGEEVFYSVDENGEIDIHAPYKRKGEEGCGDIHVLQWKGRFEEGILLTCWDILKQNHYNPLNFPGLRRKYLEKINDETIDPDVRKAYQANVRAFLYDLLAFMILGLLANLMMDWKDDVIKEAKESGELRDGILASTVNIGVTAFYNSTLDLNWPKSIFEPGTDWNPVAIAYTTREAKRIYNFAMGDSEFSDTIIKSFSATRQFSPVFDVIKT